MDPPQPEQVSDSESGDSLSQQDAADTIIKNFFLMMDAGSTPWTDPFRLAQVINWHFGSYPPGVAAAALWAALRKGKLTVDNLNAVLIEMMPRTTAASASELDESSGQSAAALAAEPSDQPAEDSAEGSSADESAGTRLAEQVILLAQKAGDSDTEHAVVAMLVENDPYYISRTVTQTFLFLSDSQNAMEKAFNLLSDVDKYAILDMLTAMLDHGKKDISMLLMGVHEIRPEVYEEFLGQLTTISQELLFTVLVEQLDPANPHPLLGMIREFLARLNYQEIGYILNKVTQNNLPAMMTLLDAVAPVSAGDLFACMAHSGTGGLNNQVILLNKLWAQDNHLLASVCFMSVVTVKVDSPDAVDLLCELLEYSNIGMSMALDFLTDADPSILALLLVAAFPFSGHIENVLLNLIGRNTQGVRETLVLLRNINPDYAAQLEEAHPELGNL